MEEPVNQAQPDTLTPEQLKQLVQWSESRDANDHDETTRAFYALDGRLDKAFEGKLPDDCLGEDVLTAQNLLSKILRPLSARLSNNNPGIYVKPDDPDTAKIQGVLTRGLAQVLRTIGFKQKLDVFKMKCLVGKRAAFKVGWDEAADLPTLAVIDPRTLYFDPKAQTPNECKWFIHVVELTKREYKKLVASGMYRQTEKEPVDSNPKLSPQTTTDDKRAPTFQQVYYVYEFYDIEGGFVSHWVKDDDKFCFGPAPLAFNPIVFGTLDINGRDCSGAAEAARAMRQQRNAILNTYMQTETALRSIPAIIADASAFDEDDAELVTNPKPGELVWVRLNKSDNIRTLADVFYQMPYPQLSPLIQHIAAEIERDATDDAGYSENMAGKSAGFRTAKEAGMAEASGQSRIDDKEGNLNEVISRLGDLLLYVISRYRKQPLFVPPAEEKGGVDNSSDWDTLYFDTIRRAMFHCEVGLYNPARNTPDIYAEFLLQNMANWVNLPWVDGRKLMIETFRAMGYTAAVVKSEEAMQQEAAAAQPQPAPPGGMPAEAPPEMPQMPPMPA